MFTSSTNLTSLERRLRRVEALLELVATRLEISPEDIALAGRAGTAKPQVPPEVAELAAAGKKIQAIKRLRELQGLDLVTAKGMVDEL